MQQQALHAAISAQQQRARRVAVQAADATEVVTPQMLGDEIVHIRLARVALAHVSHGLVHDVKHVLAQGERCATRGQCHRLDAGNELHLWLACDASCQEHVACSDEPLCFLERSLGRASRAQVGEDCLVEPHHVLRNLGVYKIPKDSKLVRCSLLMSVGSAGCLHRMSVSSRPRCGCRRERETRVSK